MFHNISTTAHCFNLYEKVTGITGALSAQISGVLSVGAEMQDVFNSETTDFLIPLYFHFSYFVTNVHLI